MKYINYASTTTSTAVTFLDSPKYVISLRGQVGKNIGKPHRWFGYDRQAANIYNCHHVMGFY